MSGEGGGRYVLFGTDLEKIPCFRRSYINGILAGVGSGLMYFLFTSKPKRASDIGFGVFFVTSMGYYVYCRYEWFQMEKRKYEFEKARSEGRIRLYEKKTE